MSVPRRYRIALLAFPGRYRALRGPELLATLADGDDDRGRPSTREAIALTHRGLSLRASAATSPDGLLVLAALVSISALVSGYGWAERQFLFRGEVGAFGTDAPGFWWQVALGVCAWVVLAAGPLQAADSVRRRRAAVLLAVPITLAIFIGAGRPLISGMSPRTFVEWAPPAVYANWTLTLPASLAAMLGTWLALRVFASLDDAARRRGLGRLLVALGAIAVVQAWHRPDLPAEYGRSAWADLGPASFIAGLGLLLAVAALWRTRATTAGTR